MNFRAARDNGRLQGQCSGHEHICRWRGSRAPDSARRDEAEAGCVTRIEAGLPRRVIACAKEIPMSETL